jgi:DNA-binding transcriptional MerR regulator
MLINDNACIMEMSKDGILHNEELGLINWSPTKAGSRTYRNYDPSVLERINQIPQAQQLGNILKGIGPFLQMHGAHKLSGEETIAFL